MEPDFNMKSTDAEESSEELKIRMTVKNVNYDKLVLDGELKTSFVQSAQTVIAHEAGQGVYPMHVDIVLSPGSVVVTAHVDPPAYISRSYLQRKLELSSVSQHLAESIASIPNIATISSGSITVSDPDIETVVKATGLSTSEHGDDSKTELLMIAAAASGGLAICMCFVSLCMWRKLRAHKNLEVNLDGTTVAIGRPVPPSDTNNVADGTPVVAVPADERKANSWSARRL